MRGIDNADLKALIRTIPDYPKAGIQFRDLTTLLLDARGFALTVERMAARIGGDVDCIAAIEARGFIFGAALAREIGAGLVLIRKSGKLPGAARGIDYALEYGHDRLEMHDDAVGEGSRVLLVDDLIATGGTALAATELMRGAGGIVDRALFVVDLPDLGGAARLGDAGVAVEALVAFDGD